MVAVTLKASIGIHDYRESFLKSTLNLLSYMKQCLIPLKPKKKFGFSLFKSKLESTDTEKRYVVGHSNGAVAIIRLLEIFKMKGAFIVAGCVTHLGYEEEKISGYYPEQSGSDKLRPWEWEKMKENSGWLVQFGSEDDCFIPINETREIKDQLKLPKECYYEFSKEQTKSHFMSKFS